MYWIIQIPTRYYLRKLCYDTSINTLNHKWLWLVISLCLIAIGLGMYFLPQSPLWPQERVALGLPYRAEDPPIYIEPMGETINHPIHQTPYGHPGIDFRWDHSTEIIASLDGKVSAIEPIVDHKTSLVNIKVRSGKYAISYDELERPGDGVIVGSELRKGDVVGYVHPEFLQMHWDFGYAMPFGEPLCPMTYFEESARKLIEKHWQDAHYKYRDKFPDICSGDFANRH